VTLDELLALLPDNETGEIGADDLRIIVSDLYAAAHTGRETYSYDWTTNATPGAGRVRLGGVWGSGPNTLLLSETSVDGSGFPFAVADRNGTRFLLGTYREIPVDAEIPVGAEPTNNLLMSLVVEVPPQ
jgi:hypothetical protein